MSKRWRLAWFAAVAFVGAFGAGELVRWTVESVQGPSWWAIDLMLVLDASGRLVDGTPLYADPKFLYPPLAAIIAIPLTWCDAFTVSVAYALVKVAFAAAGTAWLTQSRLAIRDRLLAGIGVIACLPFLHDLFLGNANGLIVAAMVPAVFGGSRFRNGALLGLAAAVFAKPLILPVLLWLVVWRRQSFLGACFVGAAATGVALVALGPVSYAEWVAALRDGARYADGFAGNHGVTALFPELWLPAAVATAAGLVIVLWRRGPRVTLAWAVTSGILLAPYAGTYAALPIALAVPALGPLAPGAALAIVAVSPIATTHPLPLYAAAILVGVLFLHEPATHSRDADRVGL